MVELIYTTVVSAFIILIISYPIVLFVRSPKKKMLSLEEIKYELIYARLGLSSMMEDVWMTRKNKVELEKKSGDVIVITGGLRGIGLEVIRMLLQCDVTVVVGCRQVDKGQDFTDKMRTEGTHLGKLDFKKLDLNSMESVKEFAESVKMDYPKINVLINNAGVMCAPYAITEDGFESQMATNYLGHFLLTHLLLNRLSETGTVEVPARIVNVTSITHTAGKINFEDINSEKQYIAFKAYSQTKLAQVLFSTYLNGFFKQRNYHVESYAVHPGIVDTDIFNGTILKRVSSWLITTLFKTPQKGAIPIVFCAISPLAKGLGGSYISNCVKKDMPYTKGTEDLQERLFNFTMDLLNIKKFGKA